MCHGTSLIYSHVYDEFSPSRILRALEGDLVRDYKSILVIKSFVKGHFVFEMCVVIEV